MPTYTFEDTQTGEVFTDILSMNECDQFKKDNPHIKQLITRMNIVSGVAGKTHKNDQGWGEMMSRLGDANPNTSLGERYGSKSIKDTKIRNAVDKWRKKRAADKNR